MKVYQVATRTFFKENNIDYAMAVDMDNDIKLFSSYWDAHKELESIMKNLRENFANHEICTSSDDENFSIVFYNKSESVRYIVTLNEKEVR